MHYPTGLQKISDTLSLHVPLSEMIKPVYENLLAKDAATPFPFWAQIWPSAKAMAVFLLKEPQWVIGKTVLELGAGLGLPSFSIADHATQLIISDHAPEAVSLLEKNIHFLSLENAKAICIDWNNFPENINAEVLLLSDINYAPDQFQTLLNLIKVFLDENTTIILSTPQRITITPFAEALKPFVNRSVLQSVQHLGKWVEIRLLILSK